MVTNVVSAVMRLPVRRPAAMSPAMSCGVSMAMSGLDSVGMFGAPVAAGADRRWQG
jgi:hypothetical protein